MDEGLRLAGDNLRPSAPPEGSAVITRLLSNYSPPKKSIAFTWTWRFQWEKRFITESKRLRLKRYVQMHGTDFLGLTYLDD